MRNGSCSARIFSTRAWSRRVTTSAFTLAKCIRDAQDTQSVVTRLDQARVEKILAEHDPFRTAS